MLHESDGMTEIFDDGLRQAIMVAARIGEQLARARQEHLVAARAASEKAARETQARYDAERLSARAAVQSVAAPSWWDSASPEQIGAAYETTTAWKDQDSDIAANHEIIEKRLADRGISPNGDPAELTELIRAKEWAAEYEPGMNAAYNNDLIRTPDEQSRERMNNQLVAAFLARPETQHSNPEPAEAQTASDEPTQRQSAPGDQPEDLQPAADKAAANVRGFHTETQTAWDTAERRGQFAESLAGSASEKAIKARQLADLAQGTPARMAVNGQRSTVAASSKPGLNNSRTATKTVQFR